MNKSLISIACALLGTASLAGCAAPEFKDPNAKAAAMSAFASGRATMSCGSGLDCMIQWNVARQSIAGLVQAQRWNDVAEAVLATGYDVDLAWFYLGMAAANLGDNDAARAYFDESMKRTAMAGLFTCQSGGDGACDGVSLPQDAQTALASVPPPVEEAAAETPAPVHHHRHKHVSTASSQPSWVAPVSASNTTGSSGSGSGASGWVAPAPTGASSSSTPAQ